MLSVQTAPLRVLLAERTLHPQALSLRKSVVNHKQRRIACVLTRSPGLRSSLSGACKHKQSLSKDQSSAGVPRVSTSGVYSRAKQVQLALIVPH